MDRVDPAPETGWVGLVALVTSIQAALALLTRALPLLGLPLTLAAGVPPEAVGQLAAATSFGSMVFFLWGPGLLADLPSLRQLQAGCVLGGGAVLLCLQGEWIWMLLAAFLVGVGYGPSAPAGSDLLMRAAPAGRRAFAFSIKQAGVPLGGLAAGWRSRPSRFGAGSKWRCMPARRSPVSPRSCWRAGAARWTRPAPSETAPMRRPSRG